MKYQIQSYQLVYATGQHDTVKIPIGVQPIVENLDSFRKEKRAQYNCKGVNLTYLEIKEKS